MLNNVRFILCNRSRNARLHYFTRYCAMRVYRSTVSIRSIALVLGFSLVLHGAFGFFLPRLLGKSDAITIQLGNDLHSYKYVRLSNFAEHLDSFSPALAASSLDDGFRSLIPDLNSYKIKRIAKIPPLPRLRDGKQIIARYSTGWPLRAWQCDLIAPTSETVRDGEEYISVSRSGRFIEKGWASRGGVWTGASLHDSPIPIGVIPVGLVVNTCIYTVVGTVLIAVYHANIVLFRTSKYQCVVCGYPLVSCGIRCPECGTNTPRDREYAQTRILVQTE